MDIKLNKGDILYYARYMPSVDVNEICEVKVRTIENDYFVCIGNTDKRAFLFGYDDLNNTVFINRKEALDKLRKLEKGAKQYGIFNDKI